jgi:hypothetical protein
VVRKRGDHVRRQLDFRRETIMRLDFYVSLRVQV